MKSFYFLSFLLLILLSFLISPINGQANLACTSCCAAYWTCKAITFGLGGCDGKHSYCLSRCECYKFA